eukprot:scaffold38264_cov61-Phaeocystis_antarctica.AAC.9
MAARWSGSYPPLLHVLAAPAQAATAASATERSRQPALPRVVLLREQPRLLADQAELQRARTRPLTEGVVQLVAVSLHVQVVVVLQLRQGPSAADLRAAGLLGLRVDLCVVGLLHLCASLRSSGCRRRAGPSKFRTGAKPP